MVHNILFPIGLAILLSVLITKVAHKIRVQNVVGYLLTGVILGPLLLGLFDAEMVSRLNGINDLALGVIAFIIGREIHSRYLKQKLVSVVGRSRGLRIDGGDGRYGNDGGFCTDCAAGCAVCDYQGWRSSKRIIFKSGLLGYSRPAEKRKKSH